jgi:DNA-binding MarR family transcriptional regulator
MTLNAFEDKDIAFSYGLVWGWLHLANRRYGTMPTGEMQVTLTIVMLSGLGYDPTVTELAEITGLAKSNVSRYVSGQMSQGFLEEYIDSSDRRRRKLRPSDKAEPELKWHAQHVQALFDLIRKQQDKGKTTKLDFNELLKNLRAITQYMNP